MSTRDLHEYIPGQFQTITRYPQGPAGNEAVSFLDENQVRLAGYEVELWSAASGGVKLVENVDYGLSFLDVDATASEGFDIWGGYTVLTPAYQAVTLYLTAKIVGGYTFRPYRPQTVKVSTTQALTMEVISDMVVIADASAGAIILTLPDVSADINGVNSQVVIIPKGGTVNVTHPTLPAAIPLNDAAGSFLWTGAKWIGLGSAGGDVQYIPGDPATVKDWVKKFENLTTPPDFVVNQWGAGIFYVGIQYLFGTTPGRATCTMFVNPGDGFNRYGLVAMDFTGQDSWLGMNYTDADQRFTPISSGPDYTALKLTVVYKWENVSSAVLSPAVDGWDLVWTGDSLTVPNAWGIGLYEAVLGDPGNYSTSVVRVNDILESVTGTSSETLTDRVDFTGGNFVSPSGIREIRRFSGMLNVFHSYGVPKGYIYGMETTYTTTSGTVKAGECASYGSAFPMALAANMTKILGSAEWAPGNNAGGRFTIIPVSASVHFFVISDGARTDCGFDTDVDAANRPAGWTYYRRVASFKLDSAGLIQTNFQRGDDFTCITRQVITFSTISLTRVTQALPGIPANVELMARMRIKLGGISAGAPLVVITETDGADVNPATIFDLSGSINFDYGSEFERRVLGPTPSISHRTTVVNGSLIGQVLGWRDDRGRFGGK